MESVGGVWAPIAKRWIYGFSHFNNACFFCMSVIVHVSVSVFLSFCTFVDVRRLSSIFAMFYCLSQMFVDFRKSAFLHFCISPFLHCGISACLHCYFLSLCMDPPESVGVNRLESVGEVWAGIAKRNNKRRIASDAPRSFSRFLKGQLTLHIKRIIAVFQHDHKYENSTHRVISVQLTGMSCIRCASPSRWEASLAHLHRI